MKNSTSFISIIIGSIMTLLGLNSCSKAHIGEVVCMYGTPYGEFTVKGTVTDKDKNPIEGIQVSVIRNGSEPADTLLSTTTDSKGKVDCTEEIFCFWEYTKVDVVLTDTDGSANGGQFERKEFSPTVKRTAKGNGWNTGSFEVNFKETINKE